MITNHVNIVRG